MRINLNNKRSFALWFQRSFPCEDPRNDRPAESFASSLLILQDIVQSWTLERNPILLHKSTRSRLWFTASRIERYRSNVQSLFEWSHTQSSINCNLMEDDDLVKNNSLIQIFHPIWIQSVFQSSFTFSQVLSCLQ
jgi:hypothetical protein